MEIIKSFLAPGQRSVAYLLLALPLLVIAIAGFHYGAAAFYAVPAAICVLQYFRPTFLGWLLVFFPCAGMTAAWSVGLITDLFKMMTRTTPSILLDLDDSILFLLSLLIFFALSIWLWRVRPNHFDHGDQKT